MVHALRQVHRVLKANGVLIDLRPAAVHRRVGIAHHGRFQLVGAMRERFDDEHAADRAVRQVLEEGLFRTVWRSQLGCRRVMDTPNDLRQFVDEFVASSDTPPHDWLLRRVDHALHQKRTRWKIEVRGPLKIGVLGKLELTD